MIRDRRIRGWALVEGVIAMAVIVILLTGMHVAGAAESRFVQETARRNAVRDATAALLEENRIRPADLETGTSEIRLAQFPTGSAERTVRAIAPGRITFNSEGRAGDLVYRLPGRMVLRVEVGDEISIRRNIRPFLASRGFTVSVMAANRLVVAAGRLKGDKPRANKFVGLTLEQGQPGRTLGGGSRFETTREVPLTLKFGQNSIELPLARNFDFDVGKRAFRAHIPMSIHVKPRQAAAEGRGYTLEYVVVRR